MEDGRNAAAGVDNNADNDITEVLAETSALAAVSEGCPTTRDEDDVAAKVNYYAENAANINDNSPMIECHENASLDIVKHEGEILNDITVNENEARFANKKEVVLRKQQDIQHETEVVLSKDASGGGSIDAFTQPPTS